MKDTLGCLFAALLFVLLIAAVPALLFGWPGEWIDARIGRAGWEATVLAAGCAALGLGIWLHRAVLLYRREVRGWFWQTVWAGILGGLGKMQWDTWQAGAGLDADLSLGVAVAAGLGWWFAVARDGMAEATVPPDTWVERGTTIVEAADAQRQLWGEKHRAADTLIRLGGLDIPPETENKHFLLCGSTGSGKTQAIQRVLDAVRARGGRLLAADSGGEFFSRYAGDGDRLLNPFDGRSVAWSPFTEIEADYDCQRIAKSAIPDRAGAGGEWNHYAQTLLAESLLALHKAGEPSVETLLHVLTAADRPELETLLSGTPAAVLASVGNERMLASTRSIIATYIGAWRYLPDRGSFSIRQWVRDEGAGCWLFATYRDDQIALLRHMIAGWLDMALIEALTLPEDADRQLWFVFDECDSIGKIGSLNQGLAKLRKYGGRCILCCQTIAQLRATYGRDTAQTIAANAASKLILRAGDHETARYFSDELGEQDLARRAVSHGQSHGHGHSTSQQTSIQRTKRAAVLPAELMALRDLKGFLTLAGIPAVIRLALEYRAVEQRLPGFQTEAPAPEPDAEASAPPTEPAALVDLPDTGRKSADSGPDRR